MNLPKMFTDVGYEVAGMKAYLGDLVITNGVVYYLPHTDCLQRRANQIGKVSSNAAEVLGGEGLVVRVMDGVFGIESADNSGQKLSRDKVEQMTCEYLQGAIDDQIKKLKELRSISANSLPLPIRCVPAEISEIRMTLLWKLIIDVGFDAHKFRLRFVQKRKLSQALLAAGFSLNE